MKKLIFYIVAPLSAERKHNYKNKVFLRNQPYQLKNRAEALLLIFIFLPG